MSCLKEDEEGRKITDYKEYVLTVASEMKPGVIWSEGNVNGSMMGWSFLDEEGNETNYPSFDVFIKTVKDNGLKATILHYLTYSFIQISSLELLAC
jgi:hypothetical protein